MTLSYPPVQDPYQRESGNEAIHPRAHNSLIISGPILQLWYVVHAHCTYKSTKYVCAIAHSVPNYMKILVRRSSLHHNQETISIQNLMLISKVAVHLYVHMYTSHGQQMCMQCMRQTPMYSYLHSPSPWCLWDKQSSRQWFP